MTGLPRFGFVPKTIWAASGRLSEDHSSEAEAASRAAVWRGRLR